MYSSHLCLRLNDEHINLYHFKQLLKGDDSASLRRIGDTCTLTIAAATLDDEGSYTCKATNSAGVASSKSSVQVNGKSTFM